jgi:replicative DNA helicase
VNDLDLWADFDPQPADGILADGRTAERVETSDHGAEASVLGAVLLNPAILDELPTLTVEDFHKPAHGLVWEALQAMHASGQRIDPTLVVAHMVDAGTLMRAGGGSFVHDLMHSVPTAANGGYYALRVAEVARRRSLAAFAAGVQQITSTPVDADGMLEEIRRRLDAVDEPDAEDGPVRWVDMVTEGMESIEAAENPALTRAIPTGLKDLDTIIHGMRPGDLVIVGGRPGDGKSALITQIAAHVGLDLKLPTLVCSLEMKRPEIYNRIVAARLSINLSELNTGKLSDQAWTKLAQQAGISADAPFWVDHNTDQTLASIQTLARRWKRRHDLKLLVIDYLQLIKGPRAENRQAEVGAISRGLKVLASQLDIPILVAAQLNRNQTQRSDKSPQISDLRESGSLESDAAVVILIDRPENTDRKTVRKGEADAIVAKHRHGPQGVAKLAAQLNVSRFASMAGFDTFGAAR